jgi:hypothetical protein
MNYQIIDEQMKVSKISSMKTVINEIQTWIEILNILETTCIGIFIVHTYIY